MKQIEEIYKLLQIFPTFDNVSDLNNANGFTITGLGQIDAAGGVQVEQHQILCLFQ